MPPSNSIKLVLQSSVNCSGGQQLIPHLSQVLRDVDVVDVVTDTIDMLLVASRNTFYFKRLSALAFPRQNQTACFNSI